MMIAENRPASEVNDDEGFLEYACETGQTVQHWVGTCRFGSANDSVVDARLRAHGVGGLRVIRAAVMPTIAQSNTNAPLIMTSERGANMAFENAKVSN